MSSPLTRLWTHVTSALSRLRASIPPLNTLLASERRSLRASLRALEAFCRRLAITEALNLGDTHALPAPGSRPSPRTHVQAPSTKRKRLPALRLWPSSRPMPVRITMLGRANSMRELWRTQQRAALVARLAEARRHRKPTHVKLADRIDALQRFLDAPRPALRRLTRKLRNAPRLGFAVAARRAPASPYLAPEEAAACERLCWAALVDTS